MKEKSAQLRLLCALVAAIFILSAPFQGALAARDALVKASSATIRSKADGTGKALYVLKKGTCVSVSAVKGDVARVTYKGKTGYILKSYLTLDTGDEAVVASKSASASETVETK